jgi:anti-sigma-K factor RskA
MRSIEMNTEARQTWLRLEQGLPVEPADDHTVVRQSDFEKSNIWRAVFIAAAIVVGIALFQPAPVSAPAFASPTRATA